MGFNSAFKGLNAELNPICNLLALLGAHHILHVGRIRVNLLCLHNHFIMNSVDSNLTQKIEYYHTFIHPI